MFSESEPGCGDDSPDPPLKEFHPNSVVGSAAAASSPPNPSATSSSAAQELTLSYLCDNPKLGGDLFLSYEKSRSKGKEIASDPPAEDSERQQHRWVERDFLQLTCGRKREAAEGPEIIGEGREKKVKVETLSLSLSLNSSIPVPNATPVPYSSVPPILLPPKKSYSNNTRATNSEDYGVSLSYSCSVPFSHNPSCSLTRNSTENHEFSRGENDQMWYAGEGTNGSVHSRFKPVGDGNTIAFASHNPKELNNSLYKTNSSDNVSFFPSELPSRPVKSNGVMSSDSGRSLMLPRPDRVLGEIVSESIPVISQRLQELSNELLEAMREYLRKLMESPEKKDELASLVRRLERRSDLTFEILSKAHRTQLEILVAINTGIASYVSGKCLISNNDLVEIFLFMRCKNLNCKSSLPVNDCDCNICSAKKGFCSDCMCPVCLKFDCASNTCSWVGCDACSHWCHAVCGIENDLIKPGPSSNGPMGMIEMQFQCPGCGHASEMFGFVREVFNVCAKDWGLETLKKELDCVRNIFRGSEDFEGKGLHSKAEEVLNMLSKNLISAKDACASILQFFKYGVTEFSVTGSSSRNILAQSSQHSDVLPLSSSPAIAAPKSAITLKPASILDKQIDILKSNPKPLVLESHYAQAKEDLKSNPKPLVLESHYAQAKEDGFQSLETMVKYKEAEGKLFQRLADDARRDVEGYRQIARAKLEKMDEEYGTKLAKLCLQETEERRRKKLEELKLLENSHCDYHSMKMRMQSEIAGLLERMETTKKMWV